MCGIAGFLHDDASRPASAQLLAPMLSSIRHRGPDDDGRLVDRNLAMGMRRLSIIDLRDGKQPIFDESGRYGVVFNGEIYNYRELRDQLTARGHTLRTHSDTETIVHLYEERGPDCVDELRGMFAFAIWDRAERRLFIARDRLGIKPLYYTRCDDTLLFASEIKALLQHPAVDAQLDEQALGEFLSLKYVPAPRTLFAGIRSLPPGHCLTMAGGQLDVRQYWSLSFQKEREEQSEADYCEQLLERLRESVQLRLRSDVPFGAFLSGGLDSSLIVALMAEQLNEPVKTFSVGFADGDQPDELPHARRVAELFGCDHHEVVVNGRDFVEHAERVLWHLDQPIADQATIATHLVARLARQHVKMVLTGEGGDELFAGYARYVGEQYSPWFRFVPQPLGRIASRSASYLPGLRREKIALNALTTRDEAARFATWFPLFSDEFKAQLCTSRRLATAGATAVFARHLAESDARAPLDRMLDVDTRLWLPDYLLLRGDKLTMANSLEARVPLLDHKVVEFAASLPPHYKLRGRTRKYLLKKIAAGLLPPEIIQRPKQGFPIPIDRWLRHEARDLLHDLLAEDALSRRGLFDPGAVQRLIKRHDSGYANHAIELWGLMSVEMWMRSFLDRVAMPHGGFVEEMQAP